MKIALVHDWLTGMRGGEKCLEVLCRRFPQAELFTLLRNPGTTSPAIERMQITTSFLQRFPGVAKHYRYLLPLMPRAVESLRLPDDIQMVVSFSHAVAKSVRPPPGVPHVCYCFTPMRYAWHLRDDYFPEAANPPATSTRHSSSPKVFAARLSQGTLSRARNLVLDQIRRWDQATSDRVTHFVASSQTVAQRIAECYGRESRVIYPPVDVDFFTPSETPTPREDYYLCVSALVPYKRIDLAITACRLMGRRLVVIGTGPDERRLAQRAGPLATFLGWQSDEEIRQHLRRCRALLFPGHEDFGIVPVEAQACGAPVIAFRRGGVTETVLDASGDDPGTGVFFNQQSSQSLVQAMAWLENHPEKLSPKLSRQQACHFRVERYEQDLMEYMESVCMAKLARSA